MNDEKLEKELQYQQIRKNNFMNFEMIKNNRITIIALSILLAISLTLNSLFIGGLVYMFRNFDISTNTTTETIETGGDYNEYNNSNDNRNISNYNGGE